jgi:signal transduction histidine kinase
MTDEQTQRVAPPPEVGIAGYRVLLGVFAVVATWVDPKVGGRFHLDTESWLALGSYLAYALGTWMALWKGWISPESERSITTVTDVAFGLLIAAVTHATTSTYTVFLAFGVLAAGARGDYVRCLCVTAASVLGYVLLGWSNLGPDFFLMRPAYLIIMGLMLATLGRSYSTYFSATARNVAALEERNRIARTLHDGFLQTMAGTTLHIEAVRQALVHGLGAKAESLLCALRNALDHEHDNLRSYVRTLASVPERIPRPPLSEVPEPKIHVDIHVTTSAPAMELIGKIIGEGLLNIRRHANATNANVHLRATDDEIRLTLSDDGVGFADDSPLPWSIQSRVLDAGGTVALDQNGAPGACLVITLPRSQA